jgi:hypothetical protein
MRIMFAPPFRPFISTNESYTTVVATAGSACGHIHRLISKKHMKTPVGRFGSRFHPPDAVRSVGMPC